MQVIIIMVYYNYYNDIFMVLYFKRTRTEINKTEFLKIDRDVRNTNIILTYISEIYVFSLFVNRFNFQRIHFVQRSLYPFFFFFVCVIMTFL